MEGTSNPHKNLSPSAPQPVKVEAEFLEADWERWRRLEDFEKQYEMIQEHYRKLERGVLEDDFELFARSEVPRYLPPRERGGDGGEEKPIDYLWSRLKAGARAEIIMKYLLGKRIINAVAVVKDRKEYYVMYGFNNRVIDMETWGFDMLSLLLGRFYSVSVSKDVERMLKATAKLVPEEKLNPRNMLRLKSAVLDLETLELVRLEDVGDYYFDYAVPVFTSVANLDHLRLNIREIEEDRYDIRANKVYQLFRPRFEDDDWEYLVTGLGVILSPRKAKLLMVLVGEPNSGKSTLLSVIRRPIEPLVSSVPLADVQHYRFGLEPLVGRYVWITSERSEISITRAHILNQLFGEQDTIEVARKHRSYVKICSLKLGIMAMNDPPLIEEKALGSAQAFIERLSIVTMFRPAGSANIRGIADQIPPEEAFNFLLWCRRQLEKNDWEVKRLPTEEIIDMIRESTNTAFKFLEEETSLLDFGQERRIEAKELYDMYVAWCRRKGIKPMGRNLFYSTVAKKYEKYEREGRKWFRGIGKKAEDTTQYELSRFDA
jgi:hypothetical protein